MTTELVGQPLEAPSDSDAVLLSRVRTGDPDAYALLFARHRAAATAFAGGLAGHNLADDLVAEAFTKVLDALRRDLGPTVSFRSYLLTSIRSIWVNTVRRESRYDLVDDYEVLPPSDELTTDDDPEQRFDNGAVADAFRSLPERWQAVLWLTAVEGLPHDDVAVHLGIKPNAVAALSFRAREGLRRAYLSEHLRSTADAACQRWLPLLPAHARGTLDRRKLPGMRAHLDTCVSCSIALADLDEVNNRLGALLLPIVLGPSVIGLEGLWPGREGAATTGADLGAATPGGLEATLAGSNGVLGTAVAVVVGGLVGVLALLPLAPGRGDPVGRDVRVEAPASQSLAGYVGARPFQEEAAEPGVGVGETRSVPVEPALHRFTEPEAPAEQDHPRGADRAADDASSVGFVVEAGPRPGELEPEPLAPAVVVPPGPSTTVPLSPDAGIGDPVIGQLSVLGQALTTVALPLTNVRTGSTVTVVVTNLVGFPLAWSNGGWQCPGAIGGLPGDVVRTETTVTCTWNGADQASGELTFALLTSGASDLTATLAPAPGVVDPVADNNTATVAIAP